MSNIRKLQAITAGIVIAALGAGLLWLLVPRPVGVGGDEFYSPLGTPITLVDAIIAVGGAWLFLRALKDFKPELKPAYRFIAYAQLSVGLLTLLYPYIEYYDLWDNNWFNMASYLPYLFGSVLMYFGMRRFYQILGLQSRGTSLPFLLILLAITSVAHAFLPHVPWGTLQHEYQYDLFEILVIAPVIFFGAAAYMAFRIKQRTGNDYAQSFSWLTAGLTVQTLSAAAILVLDVIGYDNWYFNSRAYSLPTIAGDVGLLCAAVYFNAFNTTPSGVKRWLQAIGVVPPPPATSADIIIYAANRSSDTTKVAPYLAKMSDVLSTQPAGEPLNATQQAALRNIYLEIEHYLVSADLMRDFSRSQLRDDIAIYFGLTQNSTNTFWPLLPDMDGAAHSAAATPSQLGAATR